VDQALAQMVSWLDVQELFETPPSFRSRHVTALSRKKCGRALSVSTVASLLTGALEAQMWAYQLTAPPQI
jgi:hypothetical protein